MLNESRESKIHGMKKGGGIFDFGSEQGKEEKRIQKNSFRIRLVNSGMGMKN